MTTADWALIVSLFSFLVSLGGFVWNVWSKFIYPKAQVRVTISIMDMSSNGERVIMLSASNYGPTDITLKLAISRERPCFVRWKTKTRHFLLKPLDNPEDNTSSALFSGGLPKKLLVGEQFAVFFPIDVGKQWIERSPFSDYGFSDMFGRDHWCSRSNIREFKKSASTR